MILSSNRKKDLERLIARTCREQPSLEAPVWLGQAVLVEIERRAALPWWRRSCGHWPVPLRALFVLLCSAIAGLSLAAGPNDSAALAYLRALAIDLWPWLQDAAASLSFGNALLDSLGKSLLRSIPTPWLYGGVLGMGSLYALFAGLSVVAYRTLYAPVKAAR